MKKLFASFASMALLGGAVVASDYGKTLENVRSAGYIKCGINPGLPGFSAADKSGKWSGFDIDFCRAVAAAVFNDTEKLKFVPLSAKNRFEALRSGEIDILSRNTTWTMTRDTKLSLQFIGVTYYDGAGFIVRKDLGVSDGTELSGATVCVQQGTSTELALSDYFNHHNMELKLVALEYQAEVVAAYDSNRCDVYTTDRSGLAGDRTRMRKPSDHIVLPNVISKEPLGPVVRQGDYQWEDMVRWVLNTLITAEELGINSKNVERMRNNPDNSPHVRRLLGTEGSLGKFIGLKSDWAYQVIRMVGNYGEIYERNVGMKTPIKLARGINQLWNKGGILYAPPMR